MAPIEPPAADPYEQGREGMGPQGQRQEHSTKDTYDSLHQFLNHDRKVLRYFAHSETPFTPLGKTYKKKFIICFFLADNSVEVRDVRDNSESKGAGTFPKFLKRQRLPKTRQGTADSFPSMAAARQQDYYSPEDFMIGRTVAILRWGVASWRGPRHSGSFPGNSSSSTTWTSSPSSSTRR